MGEVAIRAEKISKRYRIGRKRERYRTLRDTLTDALAAPFRRVGELLAGNSTSKSAGDDTIWALKDVSFEIKHGEVVGIIGRNGAGKSTLLKVLSRITEPTSGFVDIHGRVGSLLEVGTGFHPELTGHENIYLNGAILGMRKAEIERKFDEIVAFAEIERFIDTPVKHYSSGMYVRLAFAVAAHLEPEILLVDEVLAVGDAAFQKKCLGKMDRVAKEGRTVLFVSHNLASITQLCPRALWIDNGQLRLSAAASDVVASYLSSERVIRSTWVNPSPESSDAKAHLKSACILAKDGQPSSIVGFDEAFGIEIAYEVRHRVRNLAVLCSITDSQGNIVWTSWDTDTTSWGPRVREPGGYVSICEVPACSLRPGRYLLSTGARNANVAGLGFYEHVLAFEVSEVGYRLNKRRVGIITPLFNWVVERKTPQSLSMNLEEASDGG